MRKRLIHLAAMLVPALMVTTPARPGSMPPDIAEKLVALGRVIAPPQTSAIYAPLHKQEPFPGIKLVRDAKYGDDKLQTLDITTAEGPTGARPVLVHIHGGGFVRGDKKSPDSPFLDNIPVWAARNGMVGINANYRLAPAVTWPSGAQDMAAIVKWIKANAQSIGADPNRIYLLGWSAGGHHVASYVGLPQFHAAPGGGIAGAIFLSAVAFDTTFGSLKPYEPYFGADAAKYAAMSPLPGLLKTSVPLMVVHAGLDPPPIEQDSLHLIEALTKAGRTQAKVLLKTHSHMSSGFSIGTDDTELADQILAFVKTAKPIN